MSASAVPQNHDLVSFTDAAAARIYALIEQEGNYNLKLRVSIMGGGCSGFQYSFAFDEKLRPDDVVIEREIQFQDQQDEKEGTAGSTTHRVKVVIDAVSIMYLSGAQIDYIESLQGAHFTVHNPNAQTTCSCGSSFSL